MRDGEVFRATPQKNHKGMLERQRNTVKLVISANALQNLNTYQS